MASNYCDRYPNPEAHNKYALSDTLTLLHAMMTGGGSAARGMIQLLAIRERIHTVR